MKLKLVKQGEFLGTKCNFYVNGENEILMSRTQIGYALQYADPSNAIKNIHNRYPELLNTLSVEIKGAQIEPPISTVKKSAKVYMYNEKGIYAIVRKSNQQVADKYFDWVFDAIQSIKKNGYYVASDKDDRWLGIRQETKTVRKMETNQIKAFVQYAKDQGSKNAERYYIAFSKPINNRLNIETGERDGLSQSELMRLKSLETVVELHIVTLMKEGLHYKEIYQGVKKFIETL